MKAIKLQKGIPKLLIKYSQEITTGFVRDVKLLLVAIKCSIELIERINPKSIM